MVKRSRSEGLDPEQDFEEIVRNLGLYEFPWDFQQALSFALYRTYAVPSIGRLLAETHEFTERVQKRYDDTSLLLEAPAVSGLDSPDGKAAIRRINQMHRMYDISNDDLRYTLATFVVMPKRWTDRFGWRRLTDDEVLATVRYYQGLGRRMGIKDLPETFAGFETLLNAYEAEHFGYDDGARAVADSTLALMVSFYPRPVRPLVDLFARSLMEPHLLAAFGYRDPGRLARAVSHAALRLRARVVALLPPRRKPLYAIDTYSVRSYPDGYELTELGTFAPGCPVHADPVSR